MKLLGIHIPGTSKDKLLAKAGPPRKSGGRLLRLVIGRGGSVSSTDVDTKFFVQEGYQKCPPVYSAINDIAQGVGKAKWYIKDAMGNKIDVPLLNKSVGSAPALMDIANDLQSWTDFNVEATVFELTEGNLFVSGDYSGEGYLNSIFALPTDGMHIFGDAQKRKITKYRQQYAWTAELEVPASEMLHLRQANPDWTDGNAILFGQSPLEPVRASIVAFNESLDAGVFYIRNKGAQKLIFNKNENGIDDNYDSIEGEESQQETFNDTIQGVDNNGQVTFVDRADLGVIDISSDPSKALVLEQRDKAELEILNALNYPPEKNGLKNATYQNATEAEKSYWEHCVIPILERRKAGFQRFVMPAFAEKYGSDIFIDYDLDHIDALQSAKLMRGKAIKEFAGMITINEARQKTGMPPVDMIGDVSGEDMYFFRQGVVNNEDESSNNIDTDDK